MLRHAVVLVGLLLACGGSICAAAPQVARTTPAHHASDVDAATAAVTVTFDQDMDTRSFAGVRYGAGFPTITGRPQWQDARTCVLPVKLEAGRVYTVGINGGTVRGFRTKAGEPATPLVLTFRTKGGEAPPTELLDPKKNAESNTQLREAIDQRYSYRDLRKVDWPQQFAAHEAALRGSWTADEFAGHAARLLEAAQDEHISLQNGGVTNGTWNGKVAENFAMSTLPKVIPNWNQVNPAVASGKFDDGIGYILVSTWGTRESRTGSLDALKGFAGAKGLIIDVRPNMGGDETHAAQLACRFITQPRVYAKHRFRDASKPLGFAEQQSRTISPTFEASRFNGPVALLIGPMNVSSNESFILMMKQSPNVKLIGQRTYGSSGNPKPVNLANGVTVMLPSWQALFPDGTLLEGKGIEPDITVPSKPADFANRDPVIEKALEWLRGKEERP